jgi:hypothetical protein
VSVGERRGCDEKLAHERIAFVTVLLLAASLSRLTQTNKQTTQNKITISYHAAQIPSVILRILQKGDKVGDADDLAAGTQALAKVNQRREHHVPAVAATCTNLQLF